MFFLGWGRKWGGKWWYSNILSFLLIKICDERISTSEEEDQIPQGDLISMWNSLMCLHLLSPSPYQGLGSFEVKKKKQPQNKKTPWEYTTRLFLGFFLKSVVDTCLETTWLEYIIFQNLLQENLCYLFHCSGNLFLVLNELTKIEFIALFSIEWKHSWDISPEIKLLSGAFLYWGPS